ncbi:MAG: DUF2202 domain-containing protein [Lachnospiraceae bacterium]|jgi:hypothetical protein
MKTNIRKAGLSIVLVISLALLTAACDRLQLANEPTDTSTEAETRAEASGTAAEQQTETGSAETEQQTETSKPADSAEPPENEGLLGAAAARQDEDLEIADMLRYALEDEYLARDAYTKIMAKFGEIRPFVNIRESEKNHISMLEPLFEKYKLSLPEYVSDQTPYDGTLQEAYATGIQAEIENIAMYEQFLKEELPEDVRNTFERLLSASEKHLKAFERGASK